MYIADQSEVIQGLFPFTTMELEPVKKLAFVQTFFLARFCFCQNPRSPLFPKQTTNNKRKVLKKLYSLPDFAFCFKLRWPLSWKRKRKSRAGLFLPMKRQEIPFALLARIAKNVFNFYFILETMSYRLFIILSYSLSCLRQRPRRIAKEI